MDASSPKRGRLTPFERLYAATMLGWVRNEEELFWLAPRTTGPLTVGRIEAWTEPDDHAFLFWGDDSRIPLGYGELNQMPHRRNHLWLGHLIIAPSHRRKGWGRRLVAALLEEGFVRLRAKEISLVVFPENVAAIRCYRQCGMRAIGDQYKQFGQAGRQYRMIHMGTTAKDYARWLRAQGEAKAQQSPG